MVFEASAIVVMLVIGAYFLFRDTMNKIQYVEHLRLYWVSRDLGMPGDKFFKKAWMRQTASPYWRGKGWEFRVGKHTFQVGRLLRKGKTLESQLTDLIQFNPSVEEIRGWVNEDT